MLARTPVLLVVSLLAVAATLVGGCADRSRDAGDPSTEPATASQAADEAPASSPEEAGDPLEVRLEELDAKDAASLRAVLELGDEARPGLRKLITEGPLPQVEAALAVYALGDGALPIEDVCETLRATSDRRRVTLLGALPALDVPEVFECVEEQLTNGEHRVRAAAAAAMGRLSDARALPALVARIAPAGDVIDHRVAQPCSQALANLPGTAARVTAVAALLDDARAPVRVRAARILSAWPPDLAGRHLERLLEDGDPGVRDVALAGLAAAGVPAALPRLDELVRAGERAERRTATRRLEKFPPDTVRQTLGQALKDEDAQVRQLATLQLHRFTADDSLHAQFAAQLADQAPRVRRAAADAAARVAAWPALDQLLLARVGRENDPGVYQRIGRTFRLRGLEDDAFAALVSQLRRSTGVAREGVAAALRELTGQPFGTDAWDWKSWKATREAATAGTDGAAADVPRPPAPPEHVERTLPRAGPAQPVP